MTDSSTTSESDTHIGYVRIGRQQIEIISTTDFKVKISYSQIIGVSLVWFIFLWDI